MTRRRKANITPAVSRSLTDEILRRWGSVGRVVEIGTDGTIRELHGKDRGRAAERWAEELARATLKEGDLFQ